MDSGFSILAKYISLPLSVTEMQELEEWSMMSIENQQLFSEVCKLRLIREFKRQNNIAQTAIAFSTFKKRTSGPIFLYPFRTIIKYAVSIVIIVSLSIITYVKFGEEDFTIVSVSGGESVKKIQLEDGSLVWLTALSEIRIPQSFSSSNRYVSLKGRAFFDIEKNPASPFYVTSRHANVKVAGTSFDLSMKNEGREIEAILVSGKIILQNSRKNDVYEMSPQEKVVYHAEGNRYTVSTVDVNTLTSWHLDQITFENATLREIANKLSLIYDVNINLESRKLADQYFRYVINREETLIEVLDILAFLAPIEYRIEGNEVFITEQID